MPRLVLPALAGALALAALATPADAAAPQKFANCTQMNKVYPHGVGLTTAHDHVRGNTRPVTNFYRNNALYTVNKGSDGDKDGIACEKL